MHATASTRAVPRPRRRRRAGLRWAGRGLALLAGGLLGGAVLLALNGLYHVVRKPTELLAPLSPALVKTPRATWAAYGDLFETHSTRIVAPELLAALAQAEGDGNPLARTYWRWRWSLNPLEIYRPASSAVGMFQITDGTFAAARRYCVHDHEVVRDGAWHEVRACWFNGLYSRLLPSHAIELTSAYLHQAVVDALAGPRGRRPTVRQQQALAALIHLCGPGRADAFARRGFRPAAGERCGDHDVGRYLARVERLAREFARLRSA
jgi:hypothetical protein